eukprot:gene21088-25058_t
MIATITAFSNSWDKRNIPATAPPDDTPQKIPSSR